jgi:5-dehydro-2-deoxygluconokinase
MTQSGKKMDLIAIGRAGIDLYGQQIGGRLEDMASFSKYIGGSPTNTAIGAARLGLKAGLVTRVGADHFGRFIAEQLEREGVDGSGVKTDPDRLTGLVILGIRDRERFPLIFYREDCADMALVAGDLDRAWIESAGAVLINGTHLSRDTVFEASMTAARCCKAAGGKVVFDIDYRPVLWGLTGKDGGENRFVADEQVTRRLAEAISICDLIVGTEEEFHILGGATDTVEALRAVRDQGSALLVCKRGPLGCVAFDGAIPDDIEHGIRARGFEVEVFNVLGAGDAFMAGFLSGWLNDAAIQRCCELGNACGAIVVSRHGCAPAMPTAIELVQFLADEDRPFRLREDGALEQLHWATTRSRDYDELTVLAVDHRAQFEDLAEELGVDLDRVPLFKSLAFQALHRVAAGDPRFGILVDGRFGFDALVEAADHGYWIGRPIEEPKSRPLKFESSADVATEIAQWPSNHVVKCLVFYHPDEEPDLRERQERQLLRLFDACRKTGHELLVEIICPPALPVDSDTIARAVRRIYALGIFPDWWKLEPTSDLQTWAKVERAILDNDPLCRGIVLLGLSAPIAELIESFPAAARVPMIKGFAVGRTIFSDVARRWLSGEIGDEAAVAEMAGHLSVLVNAWRDARRSVGEAA